MNSPVIMLEEQLGDIHSSQIAYKLTVRNASAEPLLIMALQPHVPKGAQLMDVSDSESETGNSTRSALIVELNNLLNDFLWMELQAFRKDFIAAQVDSYRSIFKFKGVLKAYLYIANRRDVFERHVRVNITSFRYEIASGDDARRAYSTWLDESDSSFAGPHHDQQGIRVLFKAKLAQLEAVEARLLEIVREGSDLTFIEPETSFSATYVMRFDRALLEPRKYQVGFDVRYKLAGAKMPKSASVATNIQITPSPFSLTIVALVAAVLGATLRGSLEGDVNKFEEIIKSATTGQIIVGPIVALVFFNIYEHTRLGKELNFSISWRSALFVGALCGLAQDRVIAALTALIGG